ncbi:MAG TPA: hypothetical protein VGC00_12075 [Thermoanaerobaculia bacterium]
MIDEREWHEWQDDFLALAEPPEAAAVRRRVERHGRGLRWLFAGELALSVAFVGAPLAWLAAAPAPWKWAWAATLWSFTAVALAFALWNRRGTWAPAGESLAAQVEIDALRCRRGRRTLLFVPLLLFAEAAVIVALFDHYFPERLGTAWRVLAGCGFGVAVWAALFELQIRRRLARLARLRDELAGE